VVTAQAGETVVFSVANGGPPLSPRQRDAMFQPFWQADRRHHGAGLGLSICRSIVEVHGGSIWTESAPGQRVRVCFSLPRVAAANAA
jgi:signal transduction histidine kinase